MRRYCLISVLFFCIFTVIGAENFIKVKNGRFFSGDTFYSFFGTNWRYLESFEFKSSRQRDKILTEELDLMSYYGIKNLRISLNLDSISPSLSHADKADVSAITNLDYLVKEAQQRSMHITFCITDTAKRTLNEDSYNQSFLQHQLKSLVLHKNVFTHRAYNEDPVIMSWEFSMNLFRVKDAEQTSVHLNEFVSYMRSLLPQQLLSIADLIQHKKSEVNFINVQIYGNPYVDYVAIEILPSEFGWVSEDRIFEDLSNAYVKTNEYLDRIEYLAQKYDKPIVVDKFSYPRDRSRRIPLTTTRSRDGFYTYMLEKLFQSSQKNGYVSGVFMYLWGGWHVPMDYRKISLLSLLKNEKELNPYYVCSSDSSTLQIIAKGIESLQKK